MTGPTGGQALDEALRSHADEAARAAGLVLEDVRVTAAGKRRVVRVVVDLPDDAIGSVPLDAVAEASQNLSARLDETELLGRTPYLLEVTSPGVDRPLTLPRHFRRARTRLVRLSLTDGREVQGRLIEVRDDAMVLLEPSVDPRGERPDSVITVVAAESVRSGKVLVEFSRVWEDVELVDLEADDGDDGDDHGSDEDDEIDEIDDEEEE
ncbi:MAG: hypothetical protein U0Q15_16320 [Kineosporiaceae bacterium]